MQLLLPDASVRGLFPRPDWDPDEINLVGTQALVLGLGTQLHEAGLRPDIVVGNDFRGYSLSVPPSQTVILRPVVV